MLPPDGADNVVYGIVDQVFQVAKGRLLALLIGQVLGLVALELVLRFAELPRHLVVPFFDPLENALVLVVLVLPDLFLRLLDLLLFERGKLGEIARQLLELQVCLVRVLLVTAVAIHAVVAQRDRVLYDLLKRFLEQAGRHAVLVLRLGLGLGDLSIDHFVQVLLADAFRHTARRPFFLFLGRTAIHALHKVVLRGGRLL